MTGMTTNTDESFQDSTTELLVPAHVAYIQSLDKVYYATTFNVGSENVNHQRQRKDDLAYHLTSHLRLSGVYWGLTALAILNKQDALPRDEMVEFVMSCWDEEAGEYPRRSIFKLQTERMWRKALSEHTQGTTHIFCIR